MLKLSTFFLLSLHAMAAVAAHPACDKPNNWAAMMALTKLGNDGLLGKDGIDNSKTKVTRIASQQIGKDLYRQVHLVEFSKSNGEVVQTIIVNDASNEECSMSGVEELYVVQKTLIGK